LLNWEYDWEYEYKPFELFYEFGVAANIPLEIFPEDSDFDASILNVERKIEGDIGFPSVKNSGGDTGSFEIPEWLANTLKWLPKSFGVKVEGAAAITAGIGISAELDIEPGERYIEFEGVEIRPGNVQADVSASIELTGSLARHIPLNASISGTLPIFGPPTIELSDFRVASLPELPIRDFEFSFEASAQFGAKSSAEGKGRGSFTITEVPHDCETSDSLSSSSQNTAGALSDADGKTPPKC